MGRVWYEYSTVQLKDLIRTSKIINDRKGVTNTEQSRSSRSTLRVCVRYLSQVRIENRMCNAVKGAEESCRNDARIRVPSFRPVLVTPKQRRAKV